MQAQQRNNRFVSNMAAGGRGIVTLGKIQVNRGKYDGMKYSQDGSRTGADGTADCSGLVTQILWDNDRKDIPMQTTHSLYYNHQKHFNRVDPSQAQPGDIVVWRYKNKKGEEKGHTGFIINFDSQSKNMTYYGSQWGTGPSVATNTKGILKNKGFIILRPKKS